MNNSHILKSVQIKKKKLYRFMFSYQFSTYSAMKSFSNLASISCGSVNSIESLLITNRCECGFLLPLESSI